MKKLLLYGIFALLLMLPLVTALIGVAHPKPTDIELLAGEEGRFEWAIQAFDEKEDLICSVVHETTNEDLDISYDDGEQFLVKKNTIKPIMASVVPKPGLANGRYEQDFCVECSSSTGGSGIAVVPRFCTTQVVVDVVDVRTKENYPVPERVIEEGNSTGVLIGIGVAVVVIFAGLMLLKKKKNNSQKKPQKKPQKKRRKNAKK